MSHTLTQDHPGDGTMTTIIRPTVTAGGETQETDSAAAFEAEFASRLEGLTNSWAVQAAEDPAPAGDVRHKLIALWAETAVRHAIVRPIDDPAELVATVAGIPGAWGAGATPDEALGELHSVLIGWATLKLEDGDQDIPDMEGIRLVLHT